MLTILTPFERKGTILSPEIATPHSTSEVSSPATEEKLEHARLLVARALQGDKQAFGDIVDQHGIAMLRTATMIVLDRDSAQDIVQDALIQAWHHLPALREASALRPWLMRITVNHCLSFQRRFARTTAFLHESIRLQEIDPGPQRSDYHKGRREQDWDLAHALESLSKKQRVVIILHYYNGMTLAEMAQVLQTSETTLKKRIQAALTHLRRVFRHADI